MSTAALFDLLKEAKSKQAAADIIDQFIEKTSKYLDNSIIYDRIDKALLMLESAPGAESYFISYDEYRGYVTGNPIDRKVVAAQRQAIKVAEYSRKIRNDIELAFPATPENVHKEIERSLKEIKRANPDVPHWTLDTAVSDALQSTHQRGRNPFPDWENYESWQRDPDVWLKGMTPDEVYPGSGIRPYKEMIDVPKGGIEMGLLGLVDSDLGLLRQTSFPGERPIVTLGNLDTDVVRPVQETVYPKHMSQGNIRDTLHSQIDRKPTRPFLEYKAEVFDYDKLVDELGAHIAENTNIPVTKAERMGETFATYIEEGTIDYVPNFNDPDSQIVTALEAVFTDEDFVGRLANEGIADLHYETFEFPHIVKPAPGFTHIYRGTAEPQVGVTPEVGDHFSLDPEYSATYVPVDRGYGGQGREHASIAGDDAARAFLEYEIPSERLENLGLKTTDDVSNYLLDWKLGAFGTNPFRDDIEPYNLGDHERFKEARHFLGDKAAREFFSELDTKLRDPDTYGLPEDVLEDTRHFQYHTQATSFGDPFNPERLRTQDYGDLFDYHGINKPLRGVTDVEGLADFLYSKEHRVLTGADGKPFQQIFEGGEWVPVTLQDETSIEVMTDQFKERARDGAEEIAAWRDIESEYWPGQRYIHHPDFQKFIGDIPNPDPSAALVPDEVAQTVYDKQAEIRSAAYAELDKRLEAAGKQYETINPELDEILDEVDLEPLRPLSAAELTARQRAVPPRQSPGSEWSPAQVEGYTPIDFRDEAVRTAYGEEFSRPVTVDQMVDAIGEQFDAGSGVPDDTPTNRAASEAVSGLEGSLWSNAKRAGGKLGRGAVRALPFAGAGWAGYEVGSRIEDWRNPADWGRAVRDVAIEEATWPAHLVTMAAGAAFPDQQHIRPTEIDDNSPTAYLTGEEYAARIGQAWDEHGIRPDGRR